MELAKVIPKEKAEIYAYQIDWPLVESSELIEKKIKPYLLQKSKEYLQEEQIDFVNMVIKKLNSKNNPEKVQKHIENILDEESEQFTVKLWRFIIFEVLKIKNGIQ